MGKKESKTPPGNNTWIWLVIAAIIIIIGIVYFSRSNYRPTPTPSSAPTSEISQENAGTVTIKNFAFDPATLTISKGTTVTWTNEDSVPHQIVSDSNAFSSSPLGKGQTYSFTFSEIGTFSYHCAIHPSMKGTIAVK